MEFRRVVESVPGLFHRLKLRRTVTPMLRLWLALGLAPGLGARPGIAAFVRSKAGLFGNLDAKKTADHLPARREPVVGVF